MPPQPIIATRILSATFKTSQQKGRNQRVRPISKLALPIFSHHFRKKLSQRLLPFWLILSGNDDAS
jgi:hypothetical protein